MDATTQGRVLSAQAEVSRNGQNSTPAHAVGALLVAAYAITFLTLSQLDQLTHLDILTGLTGLTLTTAFQTGRR
ncbi:hypothetical protein [Streptomyces globisporus]